jgi:hypothetical protein
MNNLIILLLYKYSFRLLSYSTLNELPDAVSFSHLALPFERINNHRKISGFE